VGLGVTTRQVVFLQSDLSVSPLDFTSQGFTIFLGLDFLLPPWLGVFKRFLCRMLLS
jgi:hypothetical protein